MTSLKHPIRHEARSPGSQASYSFDHKTTLPSAPIDLQRRLADVSSQGGDKGMKENTVERGLDGAGPALGRAATSL